MSVRNLSEELRKRGHDVRILTLSDSGESYCENMVYFIRSFSLEKVYPTVRGTLAFRDKYIDELIWWKPDVIHSQCEFFSYQFAERISKKTGVPIVHTYHTLYEQYCNYVISCKTVGNYFIRKLSKWRLRHSEIIVTPSHKAEQVLKSYDISKPIYVVPTGISLEQHSQRISTDTRRKLRNKYGISDDDFVLVSLGRLGAEKSVDELLLCFAWVYMEDTNFTFLIVGDGPERQELEELANYLNISHKVVFTGMVEPENVQQYYQMGDVFICASTSETQGLTYIEAAANGLPLVCRSDLCLQGIIEDGVNGFEFDTLDEFVTKITMLQQDDMFREYAARNSEKMACAYDKCHFAEAIEQIYQTVCRSRTEKGVKTNG